MSKNEGEAERPPGRFPAPSGSLSDDLKRGEFIGILCDEDGEPVGRTVLSFEVLESHVDDEGQRWIDKLNPLDLRLERLTDR